MSNNRNKAYKQCPICGECNAKIIDQEMTNPFTNTTFNGLTEYCPDCESRWWGMLTYMYNFRKVHGDNDGKWRRIHKMRLIDKNIVRG